jgi:hypothetical protein
MVDWRRFANDINPVGDLRVWEVDEKYKIYFATEYQTPELALLRALMHQWGIETEVKG